MAGVSTLALRVAIKIATALLLPVQAAAQWANSSDGVHLFLAFDAAICRGAPCQAGEAVQPVAVLRDDVAQRAAP